MKILPLLLSLFIITFLAKAQDSEELNEAIAAHPDSIELYRSLVQIQLFRSPTEAKKTIKDGIRLALEKKDTESFADLHSKFGIWHDVHGGIADSVFFHFRLAQSTFKKIGNTTGYADATNNLAYSYSRRSMFKQALPLFQKALSIYDSLALKQKAINVRLNIGILHQSNSEVDKALKIYQEALSMLDDDKINSSNYKLFSNIATIYNRKEKYDSAIAIYQELIEYGDSISDTRGLAIYYNNIASSYREKQDYKNAIFSSEQSFKYKKQLQDTFGIVATLNTKATIQQKMGDFDGAFSSALKGLELNERTRVPSHELDLLKVLAEVSREMGNYPVAVNSYQKYISLKDSLDREQKQKEIAEIAEKYESEQRERKILELENEKIEADLNLSRSKNQRNVLLLIAALILGTSMLIYRLYRVKSKSEATIAKSLSEKETLLKEIHHRVKNNLQVVSSLLSMQSRFIDDEKALGAVNEGQSRVESMALIHQKLYQDTNISSVNVLEYIEDLTETLQRSYTTSTNVQFHYEIDNLQIDVDTIIPIGLILNELICNSLKHAFPNKSEGNITVKLKEEKSHLLMQVSDDGVGPEESVRSENSFGKVLIDSLATKLKATLEINAEQGMSTILHIKRYKLA